MHRGVGIGATLCAALVGVSTLDTKHHYVFDVIAWIFLAWVAYVVFLRNYPRERIPELDRSLAPVFTLCIIGILGIGFAGFWVAYKMSGHA
ncbi:MAG: hypothetical protein ABI682_04300 [Acidobacteriota bacterium]